MERDFSQLSQKHLSLLPFDYHSDRISRLKMCTRVNQYFLNLIVQEYVGLFEQERLPNGATMMRP
jgi:carnosine N-methyltransferase